jgi:hypothetical protein
VIIQGRSGKQEISYPYLTGLLIPTSTSANGDPRNSQPCH